MKTEKTDVLVDKRRQNILLLNLLANYCRKHRMLTISIDGLNEVAKDSVGNEIVDLFVDRVVGRQK